MQMIPSMVLKLQTNWRGHMARVYFRRLRAIFIIKQTYKRYKVRSYFYKIVELFRNVRDDPDLGKGYRWPKPPPVLRNFLKNMQRVHATWRANVIIRRLTPEQQGEMRMKIIAYAILKNKKRDWGYNHK